MRRRRWLLGALLLVACQRNVDGEGRSIVAAETSAALPTSSGSVTTKDEARDAAELRVVTARTDADVATLVRTERLRAKSEHRTLVVYAGAEWCEPCRRFKSELHAPGAQAALRGVTVLAFDADKDAERLAAAGYAFRSVPFVALPGADGEPVEVDEEGQKGRAPRALVEKIERWRKDAPR